MGIDEPDKSNFHIYFTLYYKCEVRNFLGHIFLNLMQSKYIDSALLYHTSWKILEEIHNQLTIFHDLCNVKTLTTIRNFNHNNSKCINNT